MKRENICGCSFGWVFFSPCVSETLTMTSEAADFTLIGQGCSSHKILSSFKLPKGRYSATREEKKHLSWGEKAGWASCLF